MKTNGILPFNTKIKQNKCKNFRTKWTQFMSYKELSKFWRAPYQFLFGSLQNTHVWKKINLRSVEYQKDWWFAWSIGWMFYAIGAIKLVNLKFLNKTFCYPHNLMKVVKRKIFIGFYFKKNCFFKLMRQYWLFDLWVNFVSS